MAAGKEKLGRDSEEIEIKRVFEKVLFFLEQIKTIAGDSETVKCEASLGS